MMFRIILLCLLRKPTFPSNVTGSKGDVFELKVTLTGALSCGQDLSTYSSLPGDAMQNKQCNPIFMHHCPHRIEKRCLVMKGSGR